MREFKAISNPVGTPSDTYNELQKIALDKIENQVLSGEAVKEYYIEDPEVGTIIKVFKISWTAKDKFNNVINISSEAINEQ